MVHGRAVEEDSLRMLAVVGVASTGLMGSVAHVAVLVDRAFETVRTEVDRDLVELLAAVHWMGNRNLEERTVVAQVGRCRIGGSQWASHSGQ